MPSSGTGPRGSESRKVRVASVIAAWVHAADSCAVGLKLSALSRPGRDLVVIAADHGDRGQRPDALHDAFGSAP